MRTRASVLLALALVPAVSWGAPPRRTARTAGAVKDAETLALGALDGSVAPAAAVEQARHALNLTADFDPTGFVTAGRRGEVVEDAYVAARNAYRRHRALVYEAVGASLLLQGKAEAASRYLRRAIVLEPSAVRGDRLAAALLEAHRPAEALAILQQRLASGETGPDTLRRVEEAVDALGWPSAQAEVDRARLAALKGDVTVREAPLALPEGLRLSTGPPFHLRDEPVIFYIAPRRCHRCSGDLQALARAAPKGTIVLVPEAPDDDQELRQVLRLYKHDWPMVMGAGVVDALQARAGSVVVAGRKGWVAAVVADPTSASLTKVVDAFSRRDVAETVPRMSWNRRPPVRSAAEAPPALLANGLAPGEDAPAPAAFTAAVMAFDAGRFAEAMRGLAALESAGDGWLLPPEARMNRALCLFGLGRAPEARDLLLRTGDSRFQEQLDRALEHVGSRLR